MRADLAPALDLLMPFHLWLDPRGQIGHAGPTIQKLLGADLPRLQQRQQAGFFDQFEVQRPHGISAVDDLQAAVGKRLHLRLLHTPGSALKAVAAPLDDGLILNLSFGFSVAEAVRDFSLTAVDFAATDLAIEMLYLIEAKSAAMSASQKLNSRLQGAKIAAEEQAFTDTLTGLKNRRAMEHVLQRLRCGGIDFTLMHLDLDYFKEVNDTLGHAAGDHVLQQVARTLVEETREDDTVVRHGGDEFVLILQGQTSRPVLRRIADRLIARVEQPIPYQGQMCRISASIGIARTVDYARPDPWQMLADADAALYLSKRKGRAQHHFHCL